MLDAVRDPLTHLVRNAVDHGIECPERRRAAGKPETGVLVLGARREAERVVIEVSDDGAGIDPDVVGAAAVAKGVLPADRLADLTRTERQRLVMAPGFSTAAKVTSVSGRGVGMDVGRRRRGAASAGPSSWTPCRATAPRSGSASPSRCTRSRVRRAPPRRRGAGSAEPRGDGVIKVLVVDDSRVMRLIVMRTLRQTGLQADVVQAEDGQQGLAAAIEHRPALVLSDWNMPVMDGLSFLRALRVRLPGTPFGFVTSECSPQMRQTATAAGAAFLVTKPFTPESFTDAIAGVLGAVR